MSIVVSTIYPDPRRSLARESARCRRSPLPRRSLEPWDVVDDRCDPSVFELTRLDPRRRAPAKADSRLSGFGFDPVMARQVADSSISRGFGTPNNLSRGARAGPRGDYKPLRVSFRVCWSGFCKMPNMLRTRVLHLQALKGLQKRVQDRCDWSRSPHNLRRHQRESHFCQPLAPPQAYQQHSARSSVKKIDDVQRSREIVRPGQRHGPHKAAEHRGCSSLHTRL